MNDFFGRQIAGVGIALVIWFVLHDFTLPPWPEEFKYFKDMGFWDTGIFEPKEAWDDWLIY